jgi:hypothetical protein
MLMLKLGYKQQKPNFKRLQEFPFGNGGTGRPSPAAAPGAFYFLDGGNSG